MIALEQVAILFMLIVVGYVIKKRGLVTDHINKEISSLVLNVTLPAFIIVSMNFKFSPDVLMKSGQLVILSFIIYFLLIVLSYPISKILGLEGMRRDIIQYILIFPNCGYMGYPIIGAIYGEQGVFYAAVFNLSFGVLVWTYGVYLMKRTGYKALKEEGQVTMMTRVRSFVNPGIVAVVIGYVLFLFSIELPRPIFQTLKMVGSTSTPLSMMFIGFILAGVKVQEVFTDTKVLIASVFRLVVIPLSIFVGLRVLGFSEYLIAIPVIINGMPAAANTAILASRYENDYELGSKAIFISTLMSIGTIPLIVYMVR